MFYLTYRPQTLTDIDNEPLRERLVNLTSQAGLPHALLFTGSKGTGKTSGARILAKAVNCQSNKYAGAGESPEPCNTCDICKKITAGNCIDVIEIDAASNRRIDDVRELSTSVQFMPVEARYKIYIIDEVHMLTTEAFNALLKTLEEPPKNVLFFLATTELDKLPQTIVSRCILVQSGSAQEKDVVHMLHRIATGEGIEVGEDVLDYIATHCDMSFRDAAKIFEECSLNTPITIETVQKIVGLDTSPTTFLQNIIARDEPAVLTAIKQFASGGRNMRPYIEGVLNELQASLLVHKGVRTGERLDLTIPQHITLMKLLQRAHGELRASPIPELPLELAVVEYFSSRVVQ